MIISEKVTILFCTYVKKISIKKMCFASFISERIHLFFCAILQKDEALPSCCLGC